MKKGLKKNNSRGFTLMELLVVIAIIGILVAVSIPIFTAKAEKAREATDVANMRAAAAAAVQYYYDMDLRNVKDDASARALGLNWWNDSKEERNAFGVYDTEDGKFKHWDDFDGGYGKGTAMDGGIQYGGYDGQADYRNACINVAFHTQASRPFIRIAWKNDGPNGKRKFIKRDGASKYPCQVIYLE